MRRHAVRRRYEDVVLATKPVLYVPFQGGKQKELVRGVGANVNATPIQTSQGPWPGAQSVRMTSSAADNDSISVTTDASYHPGDTFSIGGWFNRQGAGDAAGPALVHMGTGDITIYFPAGDKLTLRRAGTGDIFSTNRTFPTPYADGWVHAIFTKNAGSGTLCYLNSVSVAGTTTAQTVVGAASNVAFGIQSGGTSNDFDGSLAHWAIWSRVLTQSEVTDLYRPGVTAV